MNIIKNILLAAFVIWFNINSSGYASEFIGSHVENADPLPIVRGVVVDKNGQPLEGIYVYCMYSKDDTYKWDDRWCKVRTAADGSFAVEVQKWIVGLKIVGSKTKSVLVLLEREYIVNCELDLKQIYVPKGNAKKLIHFEYSQNLIETYKQKKNGLSSFSMANQYKKLEKLDDCSFKACKNDFYKSKIKKLFQQLGVYNIGSDINAYAVKSDEEKDATEKLFGKLHSSIVGATIQSNRCISGDCLNGIGVKVTDSNREEVLVGEFRNGRPFGSMIRIEDNGVSFVVYNESFEDGHFYDDARCSPLLWIGYYCIREKSERLEMKMMRYSPNHKAAVARFEDIENPQEKCKEWLEIIDSVLKDVGFNSEINDKSRKQSQAVLSREKGDFRNIKPLQTFDSPTCFGSHDTIVNFKNGDTFYGSISDSKYGDLISGLYLFENGDYQYLEGIKKEKYGAYSKSGHGRYTFKDGDNLDSERHWKTGLPHGEGTYLTLDGVKISGVWKDGKLITKVGCVEGDCHTGKGKHVKVSRYNTCDLIIHEGTWVDGEISGIGKTILTSFDTIQKTFVGEFIDGKLSGMVKIFGPDEILIDEVEFKDGERYIERKPSYFDRLADSFGEFTAGMLKGVDLEAERKIQNSPCDCCSDFTQKKSGDYTLIKFECGIDWEIGYDQGKGKWYIPGWLIFDKYFESFEEIIEELRYSCKSNNCR